MRDVGARIQRLEEIAGQQDACQTCGGGAILLFRLVCPACGGAVNGQILRRAIPPAEYAAQN